jgi:hypothetical protein
MRLHFVHFQRNHIAASLTWRYSINWIRKLSEKHQHRFWHVLTALQDYMGS